MWTPKLQTQNPTATGEIRYIGWIVVDENDKGYVNENGAVPVLGSEQAAREFADRLNAEVDGPGVT
jgi:hypothetical protein